MDPTAPPMASPTAPPTAPPRDRIDLATFLATRDAACPVCGYNLRALLTDRCPECGRHLVLAVGTTEPKLAAFITGLVGLASGLGFSALMLAYLAVNLIGGSSFSPTQLEIVQLVCGFVVGSCGLYVWTAMRHRLGRVTDAPRWAVAFLMWPVGVAFPVWFLLTIR